MSVAAIIASTVGNGFRRSTPKRAVVVSRHLLVSKCNATIVAIESEKLRLTNQLVAEEISRRCRVNRYLPKFLKKDVTQEGVLAWFKNQNPVEGDDRLLLIKLTCGGQLQAARYMLQLAAGSRTDHVEVTADDWNSLI